MGFANWTWGNRTIIPTPRRLRQKDPKFKGNLSYKTRTCWGKNIRKEDENNQASSRSSRKATVGPQLGLQWREATQAGVLTSKKSQDTRNELRGASSSKASLPSLELSR